MPYDFSAVARMTNERMAGELAKLTPLTEEQVNSLLPDRQDKKRLNQLVEIINSSTSHNEKVAQLTSNIAGLGSVVLKLLTAYLKPL